MVKEDNVPRKIHGSDIKIMVLRPIFPRGITKVAQKSIPDLKTKYGVTVLFYLGRINLRSDL